ncbi:FAD dependent oxidoreductase family protein [Bordetella holmesii 35009]|nr:FAD dependent oxidoreductase family protein [Bordetella holmesii 35009]
MGLAFLRECLPSRLAPNIRAMVRMAEYSRSTLQGMRAELGIQYDHLERGILNFYRDPHEFETSQRAAGLMRDFGVERRVVNADEVIAIEPALAPQRANIVGGITHLKTKVATCTCSPWGWRSDAKPPVWSSSTAHGLRVC